MCAKNTDRLTLLKNMYVKKRQHGEESMKCRGKQTKICTWPTTSRKVRERVRGNERWRGRQRNIRSFKQKHNKCSVVLEMSVVKKCFHTYTNVLPSYYTHTHMYIYMNVCMYLVLFLLFLSSQKLHYFPFFCFLRVEE